MNGILLYLLHHLAGQDVQFKGEIILLQKGQTPKPLWGGKEVVMVHFTIDRLGGVVVDGVAYAPHARGLAAVPAENVLHILPRKVTLPHNPCIVCACVFGVCEHSLWNTM